MDPSDDVVGRLAALIDRHSPRRVLVVVRHAVTSRWLASLLAERGVVLGARIVDLEGLLRSAAIELAGEPLAPLRVLGLVRAALLDDPERRYAAIAEQPSYQREVLRCFVELERGIEGNADALASLLSRCSPESRDRAMVEAFARFREAVAQSPWWHGSSLARVLEGHAQVSFLRRRAAAVALGFTEPTLARWEARLLDTLGIERWDRGGSRMRDEHRICVESARSESASSESASSDSERVELARGESAKVASALSDSERVELARGDSANSDSAKVASARSESASSESASSDSERVELARGESAKVASARSESASSESASSESALSESERAELARGDSANSDSAKVASAKIESARIEQGALDLRLSCASLEAELAAAASPLRADSDEPASVGHGALDLRLSCAGPEAEIAAVARLLRADPELPSVILAPADALPRWAARLGHRNVPIRAWVDRRAADTSTARTVRALLRILATPEVVRRTDLEATLFGSALRAWAAVSEQLELDYPRSPNPGDLRAVWDQQRATSFSLAALAGRIRGAAARGKEALEDRARHYGWASELLADRRARVERAHALVAATIDRIAALTGPNGTSNWAPASLRTLLEDWDLLGRAAIHGVESAPMGAARVISELLGKSAPGLSPEELAADLDHALARASVGSWEQTRSIAGGPPVWLVPYASAADLGQLPKRVILTGLDSHPPPPIHHGPVSEALRASLGLVLDAGRFTFELRELDALVARARSDRRARPVVGSWRHRDGAGNRRPPGPWIAGRQGDGPEQLVGVDAIALPVSEPTQTGAPRVTSPLERALIDWAKDPELRRRVEAIQTHDSAAIGPHTGELDLAINADRPYSASALQRYAELPYRYFVERVIGLRERERPAESASALLATEQGQVVHRALETALAKRLAAVEVGPLELSAIAEPLLAEVLDALALGYRKRAEHGQAEAIWASERDRWATELSVWWEHWRTRLVNAWANPNQRKPEPDVLIPSPLLLATEWSPQTDDASFELDLGVRTIPFVAALDRVEIDPVRQRLNVCDYKTGRPRWPAAISAQLRAGVHLQLPLYALAVEQVARDAPERLRLNGPVPVGAMRLEYLQRPYPSASGRPVTPQARGFAPDSPLGVDASAQVWTVRQAAVGFTLAFVAAIEAGRFPIIARMTMRRGRSDRLHELARVVASPQTQGETQAETLERSPSSWALPPALQALPDPKLARGVVQ